MSLRGKPLLWISLIIASFFIECVKEGTVSCGPQGLSLYFYTKTICATDTTYVGRVTDLRIGVFDENERLVTYVREQNVDLYNGFFQQVEVDAGVYSVIVWTGLEDAYFDVIDFQPGVTSREDVLFHLKRNGTHAYSLNDKSVFQGESSVVEVAENKSLEALFVPVGINLLEITNSVTISIEGVNPDHEIEIVLEADNGSMNMDGTIAPDEVLEYDSDYTEEKNVVTGYLTTLRLESMNNTLIIRDKTTGVDIFRGGILRSLISRNPELRLPCDHDFEISFNVMEPGTGGTYMITEIRVNNWIVHSYETEL